VATQHKLHAVRKHARGGKKREKGKLNADINVTPLVDVVLVLLIIFMVVTPMIASGVAVDLPQTKNHDKKPDDGKDIIVSITHDKKIYMGQRVLKVDEVPGIVETERRKFPEKTLYLKADHRANYGTVRDVMEAIHKAGVNDIMLGTEEIKKK
jgi:biopolymer transport protein TolR